MHGTLVLCRICSSACKANGNTFDVLCKFVVLIQSTFACFLLSLAHLEGFLKRLGARIGLSNVASPGRLPPRGPYYSKLPRSQCDTRQDNHVRRALFPDSAASVSTFATNIYKTTTVVAHRGPIRFGGFLAFVFDLTFRLLPVAAGILTGAFGTHALKSMGLSQDRVEAFITAAHYAVITCYRY